jgi:Outer membrane protein beta-barrel domain
VKRYLLLFVLLTFFALAASAQQADVAFGISTVSAPSAADATGNHFPQSLDGGTYVGFSGDYLIKNNFGFGGEISWRASQGNYADIVNYRPIFWDFNGVYAPPLGDHAALDLQAGIGALSTRYYTGINCTSFSCTNYTSSNHFMGHFMAGIKLYPHGGFFIRPEANLYLVNNNIDYSSARALRYGVSIGYTFGKGGNGY